jgi:hypothetical protein
VSARYRGATTLPKTLRSRKTLKTLSPKVADTG